MIQKNSNTAVCMEYNFFFVNNAILIVNSRNIIQLWTHAVFSLCMLHSKYLIKQLTVYIRIYLLPHKCCLLFIFNWIWDKPHQYKYNYHANVQASRTLNIFSYYNIMKLTQNNTKIRYTTAVYNNYMIHWIFKNSQKYSLNTC